MKAITKQEAEKSIQALVKVLKQNNLPAPQEKALIGAVIKALKQKHRNKNGGISAA